MDAAQMAMQPEHVMLATDSGPSGISAVHWLADRGIRRRLDVEIVDVVDPADELGADPAVPRRTASLAVDEAKRLLERLVPGISVGTTVLEGEPIATVRHAARPCDLLVVGSPRVSHSGLHVFPGFATTLAADAFCPTVVVPRGWEPSPGPVVVGVAGDGSEDDALQFAARAADTAGRDLHLLHTGRPDDARDPDSSEATERARLDAVVDRLHLGHPDLRIVPLLDPGTPARALEHAGQSAALVVVGSRGLDIVDRLLSRSVSRAVLERLACPVAVVPRGG